MLIVSDPYRDPPPAPPPVPAWLLVLSERHERRVPPPRHGRFRRATLAPMRWILRRWLLAGGKRSFLAGYIGCLLLIGLVDAIVAGIEKPSLMSVLGAPLGFLLLCFLAPVGLIVGMALGIDAGFPGWQRWHEWGPWDGRLLFMGLTAGLVVLVIVGRRLEERYPVPDGGDGTLRVPTARAVTAHLFPTVPWKQFIGPILLAISGAAFAGLGLVGLEMLGALNP